MSLTNITGQLTAEGLDELVGLIARSKLPASVVGQISQVVAANRDGLIGLSKDVVVAAIKAIQAGKTEEAEALILVTAKHEQLLASLLGRADARTGRAKIRGKAGTVFRGIIAALVAFALNEVAPIVLAALGGEEA